jgi:hemerythrin-like domain-containing protein
MNSHPVSSTRRQFVQRAALFAASPLAIGAEPKPVTDFDLIAPGEDLMREHGVLKRVMLVYDEVLRHLDRGEEVPPEVIRDSAKIIRGYIEDYHEKLEEDFYFPRFKNTPLASLAEVLLEQHLAGRKLTDITLRLATPQAMKIAEERGRLADSVRTFVRMYGPHEVWEDTVLFPQFRKLVGPHEYAALAEDFEKREREVFGEDPLEQFVERVAAIEKKLGIFDLAQFTPKI